MSDRHHSMDYMDLLVVAGDALQKALADGIRKGYGPGHWKSVGVGKHLDHARNHAARAYASSLFQTDDDRKRHIEHAVCRLLMAYARIGEKKE